jgi:hypothetical protein
MFFRNMISDLFGRSGKKSGLFIPYFQYKIGPYQSDYYLYFPKQPYVLLYKNEIFNKLNEYFDSEIADYLEFHYSAYHDKQAFLRFLRYELYGRLNRKSTEQRRQKLQLAQDWVTEKQKELQSIEHDLLQQEIEQDVRAMLPAGRLSDPAEIEKFANALSQKLAARLEKVVSDTEERMLSLTDSFATGKIELNNQNHLDYVIKVFKILKDVQAPKTAGKVPEQLFSKFTDTDIAAILHLHFEPLKSKRLGSIQKIDMKRAEDLIPGKSPKVQELEKVLQAFFYS